MTNKKNIEYNNVVSSINKKIVDAMPSTHEGSQQLADIYKAFNESATPIMSLKPFITGAQKIETDDASVKDVLEFSISKIKNDNLNFLINLCKEEHLDNMRRNYHPSPKDTIKDFEEHFDKDGSELETLIRQGVFDSMKSNLLTGIKKDLKVEPIAILNESNAQFNGALVKYSPIGLTIKDEENNRLVVLTESSAFTYDRGTQSFTSIDNPRELVIDNEQRKIMSALNTLAFNPTSNVYSLNENWDMQLELHPTGAVTVNGQSIPNEKVEALLFESIGVYELNPLKVKNYNRLNYLRDIDNFKVLMENHSLLTRLDNLEVVKNLNENSYVIFDKQKVGNKEPRVLASTNKSLVNLFESYDTMVGAVNKELGADVSSLFGSQLKSEKEIVIARNERIVRLNESQRALNEQINNTRNLKKLADVDSPAHVNLCESERKLLALLDDNIKDLNECVNNFRLY